jgi:hypothetical protein
MSDKRKIPNRLQVDPEEIQKMQQGYETRIERQKQSIERLVQLLDQRTVEVAEQMARANAAAAWHEPYSPIENIRVVDRPAFMSQEEIDRPQLMDLLKVVPKEYDLYNEDDTATTIIIGYIRHLERSNEGFQRKLNEEKDKRAELGAQLDQMDRDLRTARADAQRNARLANERVANSDNVDPPWMEQAGIKPEPKSFTQGADHTASSVWSEDPDGGEHEVLDWGGAKDLHMPPGEQRPGSF